MDIRKPVDAKKWDGSLNSFISIADKLHFQKTNKPNMYIFNDTTRVNIKDLSRYGYIRVEYKVGQNWKKIDVIIDSWFIIDSGNLITLRDSDFQRLYDSSNPNFIYREYTT